MTRFKAKKIFYSIFALPIISLIGIFPFVPLNNINDINSQIIQTNHLNNNATTSINSINNFTDYDSIVNTTTFQSISTKIGFLGKTKDSKTAILTSYSGVIVWSTTISQIQLVKDFYANKGINDISTYTINGWVNVTLGSQEYISILFGTPTNENQIVLFLDAATGIVFTPYSIANPNSTNTFVGNMAYVGDGQTTLYKTSRSKILAIGGTTSSDISSKAQIVTLTNTNISSMQPNISSIGLSETDSFVGFTPGFLSTSSTVDFFQFKKSDGTIYTVAVDQNLNNILNSSSQKVSQDLSVFTPTSSFTEDKIIKYGFSCTTNSAGVNTPKFVYLVPGSSTKLHLVTYNVSSKSFSKTEFDISISKPNDVISNAIFDYTNNKIYFSLSASDDSIISYIDVSASTMSYQTLKAKGSITINKPWLMSPVINSGTSSAFVAINNENKVVKNYIKTDNTTAPETELAFAKYQDPVANIKADTNIMKGTMASSVSASSLKNHLVFVGNSSGYTVEVLSMNSDNNKGTLSFKYVVKYKAWWSDSVTQSFDIPIFIDGMYTLSNVNVAFVVSENIDPTKYAEIEKLKEKKSANIITKKEVLDNFIVADITDKNGNKLQLQEQYITLESLENDYTLKVTLRLPSGNFPTGFNNLTYTASFKGFSKLEGYDARILNDNDTSVTLLKSKFPSEITFENVMSSFIDFKSSGYSYYTSRENWDYESTYDDYLGTFKITKLYYKRTDGVPSSLSNSKREIIGLNNQKTYNNFKKILSSFNVSPVLKNVPTSVAGTMTPVDAWNEWDQAISSGNNNEIISTLLYNNIDFSLVKSPSDLVFTPLNLDTANQEKKLVFNIKIKEGATLNIKYKGNDLVFSKEVENNLISKNPNKNYYPFRAEWQIDSLNEYFEWNIPEGSGFRHDIENGIERLTINLDQQSWQLINRTMTVDEFLSNPVQYKTAIVQLFNYSDNYEIQFSEPISNYEQGIVTIRVDFIDKTTSQTNAINLNKSTIRSVSSTKEITIVGFKLPTSKFAIIIPILLSLIIALALIISITYIFLRTKKIQKNKKKNFQSQKLLEERKAKYVVVESVVKNDNKDSLNNLNNKNNNLVVNRFQGTNSKYKKR